MYTYASISAALCRGLIERPWLPWMMWKSFFDRALSIGVRAAPTVFAMAFCVGSVISLVLREQLAKLSLESNVPRIVWIILNQQIAPLLTAVVFIGRSVSGTSAELANMKISEEIKALDTMGVDLSRYLLLPLLGAFLVMMPVMEIYTVGIGLIGAYVACSQTMDVSAEQFVQRVLHDSQEGDIICGFAKALVFSAVIAMVAFRHGLNASGGSDAVGKQATSAVVVALLAVTASNAVITIAQFMWK